MLSFFGVQGILCVLSVSDVTGYTFNELSLSSVPSGATVGSSISIHGEFAVVGAYAFSSGAASIFRLNDSSGTWYELDQITGGDRFATFLSISSTNLFITGRYRHEEAELYTLDGEIWTKTADISTLGDSRSSVAIGEKYFLVGNDACGGGSYSGCVYVYEKDNVDGTSWSLLDTVYASDADYYYLFGGSVDIWQDKYFIVGATSAGDVGAAYIFEIIETETETEVNEMVRLKPDEGNVEYIGLSVAIFDKYAAVTTVGKETGDLWSVYFYERDDVTGNWSEVMRFDGSEPYVDGLGPSVDLYNNYCIIGNPKYNNDEGEVYILHRSHSSGTWYQIEHITHVSNPTSQLFGRAVGIYEDHAIVGADGTAYIISYFKPDYISSSPTSIPSNHPTDPTINPTSYPTNYPTEYPSHIPSVEPSLPSEEPTFEPSAEPTERSIITSSTSGSSEEVQEATDSNNDQNDEQINNVNCNKNNGRNETLHAVMTSLVCLIGLLVCTNLATLGYFLRHKRQELHYSKHAEKLEKSSQLDYNLQNVDKKSMARCSLDADVVDPNDPVSNINDSQFSTTNVNGLAPVADETHETHETHETAEGAVTLAAGSTAGAGGADGADGANAGAALVNGEELFASSVLAVEDDDEEVYGTGSTPTDLPTDDGTTNGRDRGSGEQSVSQFQKKASTKQ